MGRITNYQMSYLLSISTHRDKYPFVRWIEDQLQKENKGDWNGHLGDGAIESIYVISFSNEMFNYYIDENLKVSHLFDSTLTEGEPSKQDIDFLQAIDPEEYSKKKMLCEILESRFFEKPHTTAHQINYQTATCKCGQEGIVNLYTGYGWEYYCKSGPGCCP